VFFLPGAAVRKERDRVDTLPRGSSLRAVAGKKKRGPHERLSINSSEGEGRREGGVVPSSFLKKGETGGEFSFAKEETLFVFRGFGKRRGAARFDYCL